MKPANIIAFILILSIILHVSIATAQITTKTAYIKPNTTILLHRNMLYVNNTSISCNFTAHNIPLSINTSIKILNSGYYQKIVYTPGALNFIFLPNYTLRLADDRGHYVQGATLKITSNLIFGKWQYIYVYIRDVNITNASIYVNNTNITTTRVPAWSPSPLSSTVSLGAVPGTLYAYIRYMVIESNGSKYFIDASMVSGNMLRVLNNVSANIVCTLPSNTFTVNDTMSIWLIPNMSNDGLVHLIGFPAGTKVVIEYKPGLVDVYSIYSSDVALNITRGYYMIQYDDNTRILRFYYLSENPVYQEPGQLFDTGNMLAWYGIFWGGASFAVVFLVSLSIFLKTRSVTLAGASLALLGSASVVVVPEEYKPIGLLALVLGITVLVYRIFSGGG